MTYHHLSVLDIVRQRSVGDKVALRDSGTSQWIPITWNKFFDSTSGSQCVGGFRCRGTEEPSVSFLAKNKPECLFIDFAAFTTCSVTIPLYATSSSAQAQYIINDARYVSSLWARAPSMMPLSAHWLLPLSRNWIIFDRSVVALILMTRPPIYYDEFLGIGRGATPQCQEELHCPSHRTKRPLPIFFIHPAPPVSRKE